MHAHMLCPVSKGHIQATILPLHVAPEPPRITVVPTSGKCGEPTCTPPKSYPIKQSVLLTLILLITSLQGPETVVPGLLGLAAPATKLCLWEAFYLKGS